MDGPQVGVGALVVHNGSVLLVLRGRAPNAGQWAIPGGKLRRGETLRQGAEREILEETGITIRAGEPVYTFEHIEYAADGTLQYHYVVIDLAAQYLGGDPQAADDARAARWVPWLELSQLPLNATTRAALRQLYPAETAAILT